MKSIVRSATAAVRALRDMALPVLDVYTDGSYKSGRGSWAYVVVYKQRVVSESSGASRAKGSLAMEIRAAERALEDLPRRSVVRLHTDCRIVIDGVTGQTSLPDERYANLKSLSSKHKITWHWIRAHANHPFNERCDALCRTARDF